MKWKLEFFKNPLLQLFPASVFRSTGRGFSYWIEEIWRSMDRNAHEGIGDDFFEQILAVPPAFNGGDSAEYGGSEASSVAMALQLGSGLGGGRDDCGGLRGIAMGGLGMPLGLNLEQSFLRRERFGVGIEANSRINANNNASSSANSGISERDSVHMNALLPTFGHVQCRSFRPEQPSSQLHQPFNCPSISGQIPAVSQPPTIRPRVRARRGQATDPHSIAERLRRERIAERMKALQELVPSCNKSDRAAMLDEIVDYVKFLRLQVKVLSMSRLGGAGAVAQLISDVPGMGVVEGIEGGTNQQAWEKWSTDGTEQQVAKLMEEDIGAAMQLLQSKAICIMPISLASAIFRTHQPDTQMTIKPECDAP